ncbi:MAG: 50S ribosomal protein L25/general stress protein Ctc [Xanthomonadaceae bacterium]|nr:50S ribosomal protein L25/general stress protein Ctc [Xanthomonadaceae bacterium]
MATDFILNAEKRDDQGKGASRRLRRAGRVPGIIYGGDATPEPISLDHNEMLRNTAHEAFYSHILTVKLGGKDVQALLKDMQRHPAKAQIVHVDLLRVQADKEVRVHVPLHFLNEKTSPGVKTAGGVVSHHLIEVEIECLPKDLPEFIEVDCGTMEIGDALHLTDLKLPEGTELVALMHGEVKDHDQPVVSIHHARVSSEEDLSTAAPEAPAAPEVAGEEEGEGEDEAEEKK